VGLLIGRSNFGAAGVLRSERAPGIKNNRGWPAQARTEGGGGRRRRPADDSFRQTMRPPVIRPEAWRGMIGKLTYSAEKRPARPSAAANEQEPHQGKNCPGTLKAKRTTTASPQGFAPVTTFTTPRKKPDAHHRRPLTDEPDTSASGGRGVRWRKANRLRLEWRFALITGKHRVLTLKLHAIGIKLAPMASGATPHDYLSEREIQALLAVAPQADRVWILLGSDAGLRNAEIRSITPDHLLRSGLIYVRGKGRKVRYVAGTKRLLEAIRAEDLRRAAKGLEDSKPYVGVSARTLQRHFRILARRAGVYLPGRSPHTLRHSFATRLVHQGVPLPVVQRLLGHSSLATTEVYIGATPGELEKAATALEALSADVEKSCRISRQKRHCPRQLPIFRRV